MGYTNETEGILKEEAKRRRGASSTMNIGATSSQSCWATRSESATSWIKGVTLPRRG
jgi:hypothetical protein